jgi:hypothetical protein
METDSIMWAVHKKMQKINMDSIMREADKKMKHMDVHMKKINDSILEQRIEVIMPRLKELDSIHQHELQVKLNHLNSSHKKMWIMKTDSLDEFDFDLKFDFNLDSLIEESNKKILMMDTMDFERHLPDMESLHESIREGMKHARFIIMEDDYDWESSDEEDIRYIDGKIIKIKTDENGKIKKAIIMSPDGEDIEVKEGVEAYNFITDEGEQIFIVSKVELKEIDKNEKKKLSKKGIETEDHENKLEARKIKIFPNPNQGSFRLNFQLQKQGNTNIKIFDQSGKIIYSEQLKNFQGSYNNEITLKSNPAKGVYFLQIIQNGQSITKKILVE